MTRPTDDRMIDRHEDLFTAPVLATPTSAIRGMVRSDATIESQRAAVDVLPKRTELQNAILEVLATKGPMTRRELERHFKVSGVSTVQARVSELKTQQRIVQVGRRDKMAVWDLPATP